MSAKQAMKRKRKRERLFAAQQGRCWLCGEQMQLHGDGNSPHYATLDHLIPQAQGGTGLANNKLLAHKICNARRGGKFVHSLTDAEIRATNRAPVQHEIETHRRATIVSEITLTIQAETPEELAVAIINLAATYTGAPKATVAVEPEAPKPRGRPRKVEAVEAPTAPEPEVVNPAPTPAEVVAARVAAVSQEAAAPAPAPAEAPAVTRAEVQQALVAVVQKHGRDVCGAICKAHGGPNLSALDPATYAAALAMAQRVLAMDTAAATAEFQAAA